MAIQDVILELNRIRDAGLVLDYAIGGAVAALAYIETSSTEDVDVFVVLTEDGTHRLHPLGKIWADLTANGAKEDGGYLVIGGWPVQFLLGSPLDNDGVGSARTRMFGDQEGRIMGPEHLAAIAISVGREKDYPRVQEFIKRGKLDMPVFMGLVEKFGLSEKWKAFETKFLTANERV